MTLSFVSELNNIVGKPLNSVEFVQDYIQFRFDGLCVTTYTLPFVRFNKKELKFGNAGYRDSLCEMIGVKVSDVEVNEKEIKIKFKDRAIFIISLRNEDYRGPEAFMFIDSNGRTWVA